MEIRALIHYVSNCRNKIHFARKEDNLEFLLWDNYWVYILPVQICSHNQFIRTCTAGSLTTPTLQEQGEMMWICFKEQGQQSAYLFQVVESSCSVSSSVWGEEKNALSSHTGKKIREGSRNVQTFRLSKWVSLGPQAWKFIFCKCLHLLKQPVQASCLYTEDGFSNNWDLPWQPTCTLITYFPKCLLQSICNDFSFYLFLSLNY